MHGIIRAIVYAAPLLAAAGLSAAPPDVPLIEAVKAGDRQTATHLLDGGVDPNATQPDGTTALHWAAYRNDHAAADLLLRAGAAVDAANRYGVTALSLAAERGYGRGRRAVASGGGRPEHGAPRR